MPFVAFNRFLVRKYSGQSSFVDLLVYLYTRVSTCSFTRSFLAVRHIHKDGTWISLDLLVVCHFLHKWSSSLKRISMSWSHAAQRKDQLPLKILLLLLKYVRSLSPLNEPDPNWIMYKPGTWKLKKMNVADYGIYLRIRVRSKGKVQLGP